MAEEMDGCSIRRYAFNVGLIKESDHHIETDDGDGSKVSISENEVVQVLDEEDGGIYSTNIIESLLHPPSVIVPTPHWDTTCIPLGSYFIALYHLISGIHFSVE